MLQPLSVSGRPVYLSYSTFETEFALKLAADLRAAGFSVWCDRLSLEDSSPIPDQVKAAIRSSAALVAVLSPAYLQARYARLEWEFAARRGYPVFPVLAGFVPSASVPPQLALPAPVDFTDWRNEAFYSAQLTQLLTAFEQRVPDDAHAAAPAAVDAYLLRMIARLEMHIAAAELREMPEKTDGAAKLALRLPSSIKALWGKPEQVRVWQPGANSSAVMAFSEALAANLRRVIVGEPGAGKSAVLERLALDSAHAFSANSSEALLPFWLSLAEWDVDVPLASFLSEQWALAGLGDESLEDWLKQNRLALFLDGMSEMGGAAEDKAEELAGWLRAGSDLSVTLTCRTRDWAALPDLGLARLELLPFDSAATMKLAHAQLGQEQGAQFLNELAQSAAERTHDGVLDWTTTPAALNGLMALYRSAPQGKLPTTLGGMFKRMLPSVWLCKRMEQMPGWMQFVVVEGALAAVAQWFLSEDVPLSAPAEQFQAEAGRELPLRSALNAGLIEIRNGRLRFRSRLLLEYFAAAGATRHDLLGFLRSARVTGQGQRASGPWDQVVLLMAGMTPNPDSLIRDVAEIDPFLAAECVAHGVQVVDSVYDSLFASLAWFARAPESGHQAVAAQALNTVAREPITDTLLDVMRGGSWQSRLTALQTLRYSEVPIPASLLRAMRGWNWEPLESLAQPIREAGASAVAPMLTVLDDNDWSRRRGAAWALGVLADRAAVPGLVLALSDEDPLVRREAAVALGKTKDSEALPGLLDALSDADRTVTRAAATSITTLGAAALNPLQERLAQATAQEREAMAVIFGDLPEIAGAVGPLLALAEDTEASVRAAAVVALGKLARPEAIEALSARLSDTAHPANADEAICYLAAAGLRAIGTTAALAIVKRWQAGQTPAAIAEAQHEAEAASGSDALLTQLVSTDWAERRDAVSALAQRGDRTYIPVIAEALHDEDSQVRWAAAHGLSSFEGDPAAVDALIGALEDTETLVSDEAVTSLARLGTPAVPELIGTLRSKNANVRASAADALGRIGDPSAVKALKKLSRDRAHSAREGQTVGAVAAAAVARLTGQEVPARKGTPLGPDVKKTVEEPAAVDTIEPAPATPPQATDGEMPEPEAPVVDEPRVVPAPVPLLEDEQGGWPGLAELIETLKNPDWDVRQNAAKQLRAEARNLRGLDDSLAISLLAEALRDDDYTVRWAVVGALAWLRDDSAIPMLLEAMHDKHFTVRLAVIRAFGEIGSPVVAPALIERLRDEHPLVREKAAEAIGLLRPDDADDALNRALKDNEPFVRSAAAEALGALRGPVETAGLVRALEDDEVYVRRAAAKALGELRSVDAVPALIRRLSDLGGLNWDNFRVSNLTGVEWNEGRVCDVAAAALEAIGTPEATTAVSQWRAKLEQLRRGQ